MIGAAAADGEAAAAGRERIVVVTLAVFLALAIGLVTRGHIVNLAQIRMRWWPFLVLAVALQAYAVGHWATDFLGPIPVRAGAFVATHLLILAVAAVNFRLEGFRLVILGAACNLAALVANGGLMPVSAEARVAIGHQATVDALAIGTAVMGSKGVVLPAAQANLWILTDIFVLPPPFPLPAVASAGDILVALGVGILIIRTMHDASKLKNGGYSHGL
jgi:hypothetical protein